MMLNRQKTGRIAALLIALLLIAALFPAGAMAEEDAGTAEITCVDAETVDELLKAIAPNTRITLTGRSYDLTRAQGYGVYGSRWYGWNEIYDDGWELQIENVENLTITAALSGTEIITVPRYACVLKFDNCKNVTLRGFTAGHTEGAGYCTGAVLGMKDCRDMAVGECDLYGCGTYGLELERCRGVHAENTTIRDCSYGALTAHACEDVLLDGCKVYGIESFGGLFSLNSSRGCAVLNTVVRSCKADSLVELYSAQDFTMAGCEVSRNSFEGMFSCTPYPVTVEGCAFRDNECANGWYQDSWMRSERAVDPAGRTYTDEELAALTLRTGVTWTMPEAPEFDTEAPEKSEDGMVHVRTVDELLAAIAPDTVIFLEDGVYDLSRATAYGYASGEYWYWMNCYDGPGLAIRDVHDLTITAAGPHRARIVAAPRYCEVLSFENCRDITLGGFTAGHTEIVDDMGCAGGVLSFMDCRGLRIEDCSLYGCGIMGVTCLSCVDGEITHTEIHDCADGAFYFYDSRDIAVSACNIHDIPNVTYQVYDCKNITADGEAIPEGGTW